MTLLFSESDINTLIRSFSKKYVRIFLIGSNSFELKVSRLFSANCKIDRFSERSISLSYDANFFVNQLIKFFGKLEKDGIIWDKKHAKIHLDLIQLLQENQENLPVDLAIQNISIDEEKLKLDLTLKSLESGEEVS